MPVLLVSMSCNTSCDCREVKGNLLTQLLTDCI